MSDTTPRTAASRKRWSAISVMGFFSPLLSFLAVPGHGSSETNDVSFLEAPVGGRPAAMGGAYSALADDAYAPDLNPGGLGFVEAAEFAGQHSAAVENTHHEHLSLAVPLRNRGAFGASVQYLGSEEIDATDEAGNPLGDFSSRYSAYNLSYGRMFSSRLSLGVTGKLITAKIGGETARA
jgi:hypothetical protein